LPVISNRYQRQRDATDGHHPIILQDEVVTLLAADVADQLLHLGGSGKRADTTAAITAVGARFKCDGQP
jgi:thiamine pyrophosphokinase